MPEGEQMVMDEVIGGENPTQAPEQANAEVNEEGTGEAAGGKVESQEAVATEEVEQPIEDKPKKSSKMPNRIKRALEAKEQAQRENAELRRQLAEQKQPEIGPKPNEDDFEEYEDYKAALDSYSEKKLDATVDAKIREVKAKDSGQQVANYTQEVLSAFQEQVNELAKDRPADFKAKVDELSKTGRFNDFTKEYILSSDRGADILYHFANNPGYAQDVLNSNSVQSSRKLVALESRIITEGSTKKISSAPDPINPIGGQNAGAVNLKLSDMDKLSSKEWLAKRNADLKAKGKPLSF